MRVLFSVVGMILLMISCSPTDRSVSIIERDFTINIATDWSRFWRRDVTRIKNKESFDVGLLELYTCQNSSGHYACIICKYCGTLRR